MASSQDVRAALRGGLDPAPDAVAPPGDRLAAVLALIVEEPEPALVFTVRAGGLSRHAGEVSFPGGILDACESPRDAALREVREEIGLEPETVEVLGAMSPVHTTVSGILVVPFVGILAERPRFSVAGEEIDRLVVVSITTLTEAENDVVWHRPEGDSWHGWVYEVAGVTVWGATGRMVHELLDLMKREAPWLTPA